MTSLIAASAFFLLIHFVVSGTSLRDVLVARLGEGPYRGVFSLASLVGIFWMASAYARAPALTLWSAPAGARPVALVLMFIAVLYVAIGLATPGPTSVGMEGTLAHPADTVRGITRITRHPFLWGVGLWALVHLLMNGDLASLILFGSLLLLALGGTIAIDAKRRRRFGDQWNGFARVTSNVPFAAIAAGRDQLRPALGEIGLMRVSIAIAVYALLLVLHGHLFGHPLI